MEAAVFSQVLVSVMQLCILMFGFDFVPLVCASVFVLVQYCFYYYDSVIDLDDNPSGIVLFAQEYLSYLESPVVPCKVGRRFGLAESNQNVVNINTYNHPHL